MCPALCDGKLFHMISDVSLQIKYMMIFQSGWFIESMWTQVLIIHMLRTKKSAFYSKHSFNSSYGCYNSWNNMLYWIFLFTSSKFIRFNSITFGILLLFNIYCSFVYAYNNISKIFLY